MTPAGRPLAARDAQPSWRRWRLLRAVILGAQPDASVRTLTGVTAIQGGLPRTQVRLDPQQLLRVLDGARRARVGCCVERFLRAFHPGPLQEVYVPSGASFRAPGGWAADG